LFLDFFFFTELRELLLFSMIVMALEVPLFLYLPISFSTKAHYVVLRIKFSTPEKASHPTRFFIVSSFRRRCF